MAEGSPGPGQPADAADRKTRVFISYSRKDKGAAEALLAALEARGFEPFLDLKEILPGEAWRERFSEARIVTASIDNTARIWDVTGRPLGPLDRQTMGGLVSGEGRGNGELM